VSYNLRDGYLEAATADQSITSKPNLRPSAGQSFYDDRGNRVAIIQRAQANVLESYNQLFNSSRVKPI
jgi:hypothetical protein